MSRLRREKVAPSKAAKRLITAAEATKQIFVFQKDEFHHLLSDFAVLRRPSGELGILRRKAVYALRYSGEYLFISISGGGVRKEDCIPVDPKSLFSEKIEIGISPTLKVLADEFSKHWDASRLRKLASESTGDLAALATKSGEKNHSMSYAERWIRQLNLSQNLSASEEIRKKALAQLVKIEEEMASLDDHFRWPSTEASIGNGNLNSFEAPSDGILSFFGYQVGQASELSPSTRYLVLDRVFRIKLPPILPNSHMTLWGTPASGRRLRKIAETIAAFVRNAKRRRSTSYCRAIAEWEFDLKRLHDAFYVGRFDFGWPSTEGRL